MMQNYPVQWWNYAKNSMDDYQEPLTDEIAREHLPQIPAVQNLYAIERKMGKSVVESMEVVLKALMERIME